MMLPDIGMMIGFYIVTRCIGIAKREATGFEVILAYITMFVTVVSMVDMLARGTK